ncbi:MAG TPA: FKBP-type peptidyl-prolyl cis-trans isomerase [Puia sp.]|nr:FKBP-type peptidyl-prolyl cis-trans isomerase [Puia sp.]
MKKVSSYLFISMLIIAAASCSSGGFKKTKSGLLYKLVSDGKGQKVKKGDFIKINYWQKLNDSLLFSSFQSVPGYTRIDSVGPIYSPAEVFPLLSKGDSVIIVQLADTLQRKFGNLPPYIKKTDKIILAFKVMDIFPSQDLVEADRNKELQKEREREDKTLSDYIAANKINAQKVEGGTYVEIKSQGEGPLADTGKQAHVLYTGKSFPSGKAFESNVTGPRKDTLKFVIGKRGMIAGMEEGVKLLKKGGKATLYIPASQAYDAQPGPNHKPFENLIFDIELTDITDAPKDQPRPMQQQITPEQLKKLQEQMKAQKK